ncbi:MAG: hypothetical protein HYT82_02385 [Candidatus Harrisonbacteria bacterium]|nr:hypothetical protein [Candidatus Harrisonbacteria bacterium]MBI2604203.1 hypothetical protein [Candidatus Harrisonbacteria bacterium]
MPWDYTKTAYEKQAKAQPAWDLERLINYGLAGKKLDREITKALLPKLAIPKERRAFLELLLWNKPF